MVLLLHDMIAMVPFSGWLKRFVNYSLIESSGALLGKKGEQIGMIRPNVNGF